MNDVENKHRQESTETLIFETDLCDVQTLHAKDLSGDEQAVYVFSI